MSRAVLTVTLILAACSPPSPRPAEETFTCGEKVESGSYSCGDNSHLGCENAASDDEPICFCDDGFANFRDNGCEDPSPEYQRCCNCLAAADCGFSCTCLSSASQCITALENGASVQSERLSCVEDLCAGDCSLVSCNVATCRGY